MKLLYVLGICVLMSGCSMFYGNTLKKRLEGQRTIADACGFDVPRNITLKIPGLKKEYTFLWFSDLHIIANDYSQVNEQDQETVISRYEAFNNHWANGIKSTELWTKQLPGFLNAYKPDAVWFGGDICDFGSVANVQTVKKGLEKIKVPYMYLRADHDVRPWWLKDARADEVTALEQGIDGNPSIMVMEYSDLAVVGINMSTSRLTSDALEQFKKVYATGKPIIIVTHVPIDSPLDRSFDKLSRKKWGDRNLSWGKECSYKPDDITQEFINMIMAKDSHVKAIFAGHVHFEWTGPVSENAVEYTMEPSCDGVYGVVKISN